MFMTGVYDYKIRITVEGEDCQKRREILENLSFDSDGKFYGLPVEEQGSRTTSRWVFLLEEEEETA